MLSARVKLKAGERAIWGEEESSSIISGSEGKEYGENLLSFLCSWNVQLLAE